MSEELPPWRKEADAHRRAMPLQRLVGNGMSYRDATQLHEEVGSGVRWQDAARRLGEANRRRALDAQEAGAAVSAETWWSLASACFRFGQVPLVDADPAKRELTERMVEAFSAAGAQHGDVERVEVPFNGSMLSGWLRMPREQPSLGTVLILGGFDGWREEYDSGARALAARGVATCLVEIPGQAEARVLRGVAMGADPEDAVRAIDAFADQLERDHGVVGPIGVWGNSMGGYIAARAAARLDRVAAVCVNGGSDRPAEILDRYPRFVTKFELLFGVHDPEQARELGETLRLDAPLLADIRCPLLVLHGTPDRVFLVESARRIFEGASSTDRTWCEWSDGDHCVYNHTDEKHALVGDWFADRFVGTPRVVREERTF